MLMWFRNKRQQWTTVFVVLFTASMLSIACQECLALEKATPVDVENITPHHCMQDEESNPAVSDGLPDSHCQGICDCDFLVLSVSDIRSPSIDVHKIPRDGDQPALFYSGLPLSSLYRSGHDECASEPFIPDRARYRPLERFCVLLN